MLEAGQVVVDNMDEKQQQEIAIIAYDETGEAEVVQGFTDSASDLTEALSPVGRHPASYGTTNFYSGVINSLAFGKTIIRPQTRISCRDFWWQ